MPDVISVIDVVLVEDKADDAGLCIGSLKRQSPVADFVDHYHQRRNQESQNNLAPADVYFGRGARIVERRHEIKRRTIEQSRRQHINAAA